MKQTIKASPAPIALIGVSITTILFNLHNAGFFPLDVITLAIAITIGGCAQIIAGILEIKNKKTFRAFTFAAYGFFWLSLVLIWIIPKTGLGETHSPLSLGFYLFIWSILSLGMFLRSLHSSILSKLVLGFLSIFFILLAIANCTDSHLIHTIAGYEGILCGSFALYGALAQVINKAYKKRVFPL